MRLFCALPTAPAFLRVFFRHHLLQGWIRLRNLWERVPVSRESPVFVVGCGHSGTTLLISILNAHPRFRTIQGEANVMHPRNGREAIVRWYEDQRRQLEHGERLAEKTASNVRYLRRIFAAFPSAQVIVVLRDGRDVACSLRKRTGRLPGGIVRWVTDTKRGLEWARDERVWHVRYEDLVTDFDRTLEETCEFLGVDYVPELREFYRADYQYAADKSDEKALAHGRRREAQARSPLFDGRGKWRDCFSEKELCQILAAAKPRLRELGYIPEQDSTRSL